MGLLSETLWQQDVLRDEWHIVLECPPLQEWCDRYKNLCQAPEGDAMILFMWKKDESIDVARFIDACLERVYTSAGPPVGDQGSDQP